MPTSTHAVQTAVFMKRCDKPVIASRADRGVRPYRTLYSFADGLCRFATMFCRVDVGIDPYEQVALSPFVVHF